MGTPAMASARPDPTTPVHPALLLALHGTRDSQGTAVAHALALRVSEHLNIPVRLGFADVLAPDVGLAAARIPGPVVVVPAFLAAGYHVRVDIPQQLARAGRADAVITPALGEDPHLITAAARRLAEAGHQPGQAVVLAAAGSSDPQARAQVRRAADRLAQTLAAPVQVGYIATATPTVTQAVADLRARGHQRVAVASWLLAPGLFHRRLHQCGADTVAAPLCPDPGVAQAVAQRYLSAAIPSPAVF